MPRVRTDIESEAVNSRSGSELDIGLEIIGGVRVGIAHHKMGDDIFLSIVPLGPQRAMSKGRTRFSMG